VIVREKDLDEAVRAVHTAFGLDDTEEAIIYGGTGR
jgi:aspartate kinase